MQQPAAHRLTGGVEQDHGDVPSLELAVGDLLEPVPEVEVVRDPPPEDEVAEPQPAGKLARDGGLVGALPVLDGCVLRVQTGDLLKSGDLLPVDFDDEAISKSIAGDRDTSIVLILEEGKSAARFWTTDLTAEYVRLNADYHT